MRVVSIFGFMAVDHYPHWGADETTMPLALAEQWAKATTLADSVRFPSLAR
jgi:hypothetical protein